MFLRATTMSDLRFVRLNWAPGPSFSFNRSNELKVRCADKADFDTMQANGRFQKKAYA
jgi:hypothetical protein